MNTAESIEPSTLSVLDEQIERACRVIAPSWPLDRQIAVNPFWGFVDQPFAQAAAAITRLTGGRMTLAPEEHRCSLDAGEIPAAALARAASEQGVALAPGVIPAALVRSPEAPIGLPLLSDMLDRPDDRLRGPRWRDTVTQQISQYCASHFDGHQADWRHAGDLGLFLGWRDGLQVDHAIEPLMHATRLRAHARALPGSAEAAIAWAIAKLQVPQEDVEQFLAVCLMRINGWASWCAYLAFQAALDGSEDRRLRELLAVRVAWEALLDDEARDEGSVWAHWRKQWTRLRHAPGSPDAVDRILQRAQEIAYQDRLVRSLTPQPAAARRPCGPATAAQLVFCIDVRSERFRRAIEAVDPCIETKGFAGFFGLPMSYAPIGTAHTRPQLPGPLAPALVASDSTGDAERDRAIAAARERALRERAAWRPFTRQASGAFSLVETLGIGYLGAILRRHSGARSAPVEGIGLGQAAAKILRPRLCAAGPEANAQKADLVASILRSMSLTTGFARLLVLVGHGSESANNPQAAALDCGACGGHAGEINARVLAGLLNDPGVRAALPSRGIVLPRETIAVAALHNTTTDEVSLFDRDTVPVSHARDLDRLLRGFAAAGQRTRAERASSLGLERLADRPAALLEAVRRRARDWAQTRPEWGLAGNAAFIVAPRSRTRDADLAGRAFLHDYDWRSDRDGKVLELIMTAPMVVTHWINLQYYASTVDPERFGSGNKVLHNVVCGRIGVFEGNTGDLRIGLSRQSVHDGRRWMHAPLRLSVVIDAPRTMMERVIAQHPVVRQLVDHEWLHLLRFADDGIEWRHRGRWQTWVTENSH